MPWTNERVEESAELKKTFKFILNLLFDNMSALVHVMAWQRTGTKPPHETTAVIKN